MDIESIEDLTRLRLYTQFIDSVIASIDFQHQTCNIDEISDDVSKIFIAITHVTSLCSLKWKTSVSNSNSYFVDSHPPYPNTSLPHNPTDESSLFVDVIGKSLICMELLSGCSNYFIPSQVSTERITADSSVTRLGFLLLFPCSRPTQRITFA